MDFNEVTEVTWVRIEDLQGNGSSFEKVKEKLTQKFRNVVQTIQRIKLQRSLFSFLSCVKC
jgi:hypothetical protein